MPRPARLSSSVTGARASNVNYLGAARCRHKFQIYYPDGFWDETYLIAERSCKERAHLEWHAELNPAALRKLLEQGEFEHVAVTALRIEARANLLSSFERMALRDAVKTPAGARLFATSLHAYLFGRGSLEHKFESWVSAVAALPRRQAPLLTWPLVTVFGFIAKPEAHLLFKPQVTRKAARTYGFDLDYRPSPSGAGYRSLQTFAAVIRRDLDRKPGFRARDMIDVQSFIWVQGAAEYEL